MNDRSGRTRTALAMAVRGCGKVSGALGMAVVALLALLTLGGCGQSPKDLAGTYLADLQQFNYSACYAMLTAQDRRERTLKEFLGEIPMAPMANTIWFRAILYSMHYQVGEPQVTGLRAVIPVKVTMPDLPLWERTIDATAGSQDAADPAADSSLQAGKYPKLTFDDAVVLVKEQHRWRVLADFARRDQIMDRHSKAISLYHSEDWPKTLGEYKKILADLNEEPFTGSRGLAFLFGREMKAVEHIEEQQPVAQAYIPKLVVSDVAVKESEARVPAIFGRITNAGDRGVDDVRMTVTWYAGRDSQRKVLYTEDHNIIVTPIEFTSFSTLVQPFAPGETRDFGFNLAAPPAIQQESEPHLAVGSIILTQSGAPLPKVPIPTPTPNAKPSPSVAPSAGHPTPAVQAAPAASETPAPHREHKAHGSMRRGK